MGEGWSHAGGGTQFKVVPCRWRATAVHMGLPETTAVQLRGEVPVINVRRLLETTEVLNQNLDQARLAGFW